MIECIFERVEMNALSLKGLAWFLRGAHRRICKNHAKRAMPNEGYGMRDNVM
jgi:hypothetical protein